jgi:hypothetical protein
MLNTHRTPIADDAMIRSPGARRGWTYPRARGARGHSVSWIPWRVMAERIGVSGVEQLVQERG